MPPEWARPVIAEIMEREGWPTFTDDPNDFGGPTKGGITLQTLGDYLRRPATVAELRTLEEAVAAEIYYQLYIRAPRFGEIGDPLLRELVIDCGVLHGTRRAAEWLQEACGDLTIDGRIGQYTLASVAEKDPSRLTVAVSVLRIKFIGKIIAANYRARQAGRTSQDQSRFAGGWLNRAVKFISLAAGM